MEALDLVRIRDLPKRPHSVRIQVRIMRVWAASPPDSAVIWYYGTVLLDAHGGVIEARIPKEHYQRLSRLLEEGRICEIDQFSIADAPNKYHVVEGDHIVYFTRQTTITPLASSSLQIPMHYFKFQRLTSIGTDIKDTDKVIDVIARIAGFSPVKQTRNSKTYQLMYLADERGNMVEVTLWSQFLHLFDPVALHEQSKTEPVVIICSALAINAWERVYGLKAVSCTRFYSDKTITEIVQFTTSLPTDIPPIVLDTNGPPYHGAPIADTVQKPEQAEPQRVTVSEFLAIPVTVHSDTLYKCVVLVDDLTNRYEWHYQACKKCLSKLKEQSCQRCKTYRNDYMNWYKLLLRVRDQTGDAIFTALGRVAKIMTGIDEDEMIRIRDKTKMPAPKELLAIIGKAHEFIVLPKEVPNCPGVRRNTIVHVGPVPPDAPLFLPIDQPTDFPATSHQTIAMHSIEQPPNQLALTFHHQPEQSQIPMTVHVHAESTPPISFTQPAHHPDQKRLDLSEDEASVVAKPGPRKRLFTDADMSHNQSGSSEINPQRKTDIDIKHQKKIKQDSPGHARQHHSSPTSDPL